VRLHTLREPKLLRELPNRIYDPLVEVQNKNLRRSFVDQTLFMEVHDTKRYGVTVPNKGDSSLIEYSTDIIRLLEHVRDFHIDLVKIPNGRGAIDNDVGDRVEAFP
jgi:hypothetical protein